MNWTTKPPTTAGFYWWREDLGYLARILWVFKTSATTFSAEDRGNLIAVEHKGGQWFGPLAEPGGDAIENCTEANR